MTTTLTGPMNSKMVDDVTQALERFSGLDVKVTVEVLKSKAASPNTHQSKKAPVATIDLNGEEVR